MTASRKSRTPKTETRTLLLDTAEQIMTEEGYPAVTTRRLASRMGVSNQLVHYYFRSMDDLFVSLLRRRAERNTSQLIEALSSTDPWRALWKFHCDPSTARLNLELTALTNHRKDISREAARNAEHMRSLEAEAISRLLSEAGFSADEYPANGLAMIMSAISRIMMIEATLGVSLGHADAAELVEGFIASVQKRRPARRGRTSSRFKK